MREWLKKLFTPEPVVHAAVPEGERVIAIGDVHGRADLLERLLGQIEARGLFSNAPLRTTLVFLGDYIDRGPASSGVIERLVKLQQTWPHCVFLRGNHEQVMLDLIEGNGGDKLVDNWLQFGGMDTLASYHVSARTIYGDDKAAIRAELAAAVPADHLAFLRGLGLSHRIGDYVFVHAGVRPDVDLDAQAQHDLLWIREPFLNHAGDFGAVVVHGHSISREIDAQPNRIGIDTGAYATGVLTALVLEGSNRDFIRT